MTVQTGDSNVFAPVDVNIAQGQTLDFQNLEVAPHNLISRLAGPDKGPLFEAKTFQGPDVSKAVQGVQYLGAGAYDFHCTLHENMVGTLTVSSSGTPVARPKISVSIKDSKLADRPYAPGDRGIWVKSKCLNREEFVVVGGPTWKSSG